MFFAFWYATKGKGSRTSGATLLQVRAFDCADVGRIETVVYAVLYSRDFLR